MSLRRVTESSISHSEASVPRRPHQTHKFLIVDDSPYSRRVLKTLAGKHGYNECDEAKDETEALQMFRIMSMQRSLYYVIFVNAAKQSVGGVSLVRKLRGMEGSSGLPRTFICGVTDAGPLDESLFDATSNSHTVIRLGSEADLQRVLKLASKR